MFLDDRCCARPCCHRPMQPMMGMGCQPVMDGLVTEPAINKFIETETVHQVPHVCPVHTHKVNKHIYEHTYTPQYTFSEEEMIVNNDCGSCNNF